MHNDQNDIEQILSQTSFRELSHEEKERVWGILSLRAQKPSLFPLTQQPMFTSLIIGLVLALGAGSTAVLADNAVPGDTLFGVDRAVENLRLNLANKEKKNELRIKFADERIEEIEKIAEKEKGNSSLNRPASAAVTETSVSEIEADVFTNETVIKIEYASHKKFVFTSEAKTKEAVIDEIAKAFPALSKSFIESKLDFENEDRSSRSEDKRALSSTDDLSEDGKVRVNLALSAALTLLNGVSTSLEGDDAVRLKAITDELNDYLGTSIDEQIDAKIKQDDDKTRIDLRSEDGRVRVEIKDGELRIKTDSSDDKNKGWDKEKDSDDSDDDSDDDNTSDPSVVRSLEIEADIFTNETVVKVELNDRKTTFTTDADTRAEIVAAILVKYPLLTSAQVEKALEIETEDRTSRIKDLTNLNGDDDSDDDDSDDDSDDDEDEDSDDNSGKGSDDDDDDN